MKGAVWLSRFFKAGRSVVSPVIPLKSPVKHLSGTRFVIVRVNGRLESVPVTDGGAQDEKPTTGQQKID
jgi:hypothetical protein